MLYSQACELPQIWYAQIWFCLTHLMSWMSCWCKISVHGVFLPKHDKWQSLTVIVCKCSWCLSPKTWYGYDLIRIRLYHPFLWGSRAPCSLLLQFYRWWLRRWQWCWFIVWWWSRCGCQRLLCIWYHFWIQVDSNGTQIFVMTSKKSLYYHQNDCNDV